MGSTPPTHLHSSPFAAGPRLLVVGAALVASLCGACSADRAPGERPQPFDAGTPPSADAASGRPDGARDGGDAVAIESIRLPVGEWVFDARAAGPEDGELVLLLHGFPETSYEWRSQLVALARAGYRAVAPDQRGYSPGARPTDVTSYGIISLIQDALGMADALGYQRFHVVGHDWGGGVAWGLAGVVPARIETLTVLSTPHPAALSSALSDTSSCQYAASAYFDVLSKPDSNLSDLASIGSGFDGVGEDATAEYFDKVLSKPEVLDAALSWYRANVSGRQLTGTVGAITVPTLYLWGAADPTFCRATAEDSAHHVDASYEFIAVEGAGHWLAEAAAEVVDEALLKHLAR